MAVLSSIAIHSDLQASVCLEVLARFFNLRLICTHAARVGAQVLPTAQSGTFLCEPLLRYFRGCRLADARWRLKEGLHLQLLQLQLSHPRCLDISVLLHVRTPHPLAFRQRVTVYLFVQHVRLDGALLHSEAVVEWQSANTGGLTAVKSVKGRLR